ncbi:hypothetical protein FB45DRAFT_1025395 [Roridomyces roridus]|uniref:Uncharacterized protein n=1 Tax=Roridomyces roridus TaxID=1738132 RepID=A0AAD7FRX3_9AGAR|nr:hypothetical protein FB45DRAFT_1025395 [Roridomyces roridus]
MRDAQGPVLRGACLWMGYEGEVSSTTDDVQLPFHTTLGEVDEISPWCRMLADVQCCVSSPVYAASATAMNSSHQQYYNYNGQLPGASPTTFRLAKRVRTLTEQETARGCW